LRGRAAAHFALGQFDQAIADRSALAEAVQGTPQWPQAMIARGVARRAAGDAAGAIADFSEALSQLDPETQPGPVGAAEYERCVVWLAAGDIESLKRRCRELVQQHGASADDRFAVFIIACCKQHPASIDDWSPVLELARRCVRNKPDDELFKKNLIAALCRSGQHEETLSYAAEAFPTDPSIGTQLWLAMSHAALGRLDEARRLLAAAEERNEAAITVNQVELRLMAAEVRRFIEAGAPKNGEADPGGK
jgi:tetratricopeptide (TPR) repeat protein